MKYIEEQIQWYDDHSVRKDDDLIKANLKLIDDLYKNVEYSEDRIFLDKIIATFCEIIEVQRSVIDDLICEAEQGITVAGQQKCVVALVGSVAEEAELPSYLPPEGGFQTDEQVKKAFTNYLTYHAKRKNGKTFSTHTSYDYSSRVKVLMEIVCEEWASRNGDTWIPLGEQNLQVGCPFLNAYNNLHVLRMYVERKEQEIHDISVGLREPNPDGARNPLNNYRNLGNSAAALTKFEEFKQCIEQQNL